jgi:hypothetical protein
MEKKFGSQNRSLGKMAQFRNTASGDALCQSVCHAHVHHCGIRSASDGIYPQVLLFILLLLETITKKKKNLILSRWAANSPT